MKIHPLVLVGAAVLLFLFASGKLDNFDIKDYVPSVGTSSASGETFPDKPTGAVLNAVSPVVTASKNVDSDTKLQLSRLYREYAKLIALDDNIIKSTADVRRGNGLAGKLLINKKGSYPELAKAVDNANFEILGKKSVTIDASVKAKAVELYNGLSWAVRQ